MGRVLKNQNWDTHCVAEEEDAAEEAEEVGGEQREVDRSGAGHLHHDGHEAIQREHAQDVGGKQHGCGTRRGQVNRTHSVRSTRHSLVR